MRSDVGDWSPHLQQLMTSTDNHTYINISIGLTADLFVKKKFFKIKYLLQFLKNNCPKDKRY